MRLQLRVVVTVFLPWIAEGNNRDLFNYGMDDTRENGARSFGQPNWDEVTCSNEDTCTGFPNRFPHMNGYNYLKTRDVSQCRYCPEGVKCGQHRQSPIDLLRDRGVDGHENEKECPDWHWMMYLPDTCKWSDMQDQFTIERHALQIHVPQLNNGDIDCFSRNKRRYPRIDYSKGFPDYWWMQRTDVMVPSQHTQEGTRYAAEVTLAHFYEIPHVKNQLGHISIFMQDYPDAESWAYLDKLICQWRKEEDTVRQKCGLPPVEPYGRCKLLRGQEATQAWLEEAGLIQLSTDEPSEKPTSAPTPLSTQVPTGKPIDVPTLQTVPAATETPTSAPTMQTVPDTTETPIAAPTRAPVSAPTAIPTLNFVETEAETTVEPIAEATTTPTHEPTLSPTARPSMEPTLQATGAPSSKPTPTGAPTGKPTLAMTDIPTDSPIVFGQDEVPPPMQCDRYSDSFMRRVCESSDPCCESVRSDTNFCWNVYDNVFPGNMIKSACYHCCPTPKVVGEATPILSDIPKTVQCSAVDNPFRLCKDKEGSCCGSPRSTTRFCRETYDKYGDDMASICHYCCREPRALGPARRQLRSSEIESSPSSRNSLNVTEVVTAGEDKLPDGARVVYSGARKFLLRPENFEEHDEDEDEYFERIYSDHQRRNLQREIHEEDYANLEWFPYEWLIKVGTEYYYRYEGTMLVPPCWEVVHWRVMKDPIRVHPRQIKELNRLLAWRRNPDSCEGDTAGNLSNSGNTVDLSRTTNHYHSLHRKVFCECKDWPSKFPGDQQWCRNWKNDRDYDRFYTRPYSFNSGGKWHPGD